jgi:hypothetical protein
MLSTCYLTIKQKWEQLELDALFFSTGLFIGVIVAHSYFWATGQNGSLGLTRIATQGMPVFVLLQVYFVDRLFKHKNWLNYLSIIAVCALVLALITTKKYPLESKEVDKEIVKAADYLRSHSTQKNHIYFHHPLFCQRFGENPLLQNQRCVFHSFGDIEKDIRERLQPGDYIIWDSHFGPQEMLLPKEKLEKYPSFSTYKTFYSNAEGVTIYRYQPAE